MKKDTVRRIAALLIEGAITVIVPVAWATMAFRWDDSGALLRLVYNRLQRNP